MPEHRLKRTREAYRELWSQLPEREREAFVKKADDFRKWLVTEAVQRCACGNLFRAKDGVYPSTCGDCRVPVDDETGYGAFV